MDHVILLATGCAFLVILIMLVTVGKKENYSAGYQISPDYLDCGYMGSPYGRQIISDRRPLCGKSPEANQAYYGGEFGWNMSPYY